MYCHNFCCFVLSKSLLSHCFVLLFPHVLHFVCTVCFVVFVFVLTSNRLRCFLKISIDKQVEFFLQSQPIAALMLILFHITLLFYSLLFRMQSITYPITVISLISIDKVVFDPNGTNITLSNSSQTLIWMVFHQ